MKKLFALGIGAIGVLLATTLIVFAIMHTRYFTPSVQWLTQQLWPDQLTFSQLEYHYPNHFTLHEVTLKTESQPANFEQVDIWFNKTLLNDNKLVIDSLLLDGANFAQGLPSTPLLQHIQINQIAVHNIDFSQNGLIARGVNLQIKNPVWSQSTPYLPFGQIQLSADQFYWRGEAFNQVLVDADYKPKNSTVYGTSFKWRGSDFSGQGEQFDTQWSLVNTTISHLNLTPDLEPISQQIWEAVSNYVTHINSLDILNSQISWAGIEMENLAASIENLDLTHSIWQQSGGYLSLNADSITWREQQLIEPSFKLDLSQNSISVSDFASEVLQGDIQLSGTMTPDSVHLKRLNIQGVKWFAETQNDIAWLPKQWPQLADLTIDHLELNNIQFIQLVNKPFWQFSGLTAEGKQTRLIRNHQWGLWNGELTISANSASIGELISTQGVIEMHSTDGQWQLERAFIPLEKGYIDATANWDFTQPSSPWSLTAHADGLPVPFINYFYSLPIELDGITEVDFHATGMAGDYSMLAHSLSGELNASVREGTMALEEHHPTTVQPFEVDHIKVTADRGRLNLNPTPIKSHGLQANLVAKLDLVDPKSGRFDLNITQGCEHIRYDLLNNQITDQSCEEDKQP